MRPTHARLEPAALHHTRCAMLLGLLGFAGLLTLAPSGCASTSRGEQVTWHTVDTEHVRLRTDLPSTRAVRDTARRLEQRFQWITASTFPCASGKLRNRIEVTHFAKESDYRRILNDRSAGAYVSSDPGVTNVHPQVIMYGRLGDDAYRIFQHELAHHLVALCHIQAPPWLHEGLAQYVETFNVREGQLTVGIPSHLPWKLFAPTQSRIDDVPVVLWPVHWLPSVSELTAMDAEAFYARAQPDAQAAWKRKSNYAAASILVRYLESSEGDLQKRYQRYLAWNAEGKPDDVAWRAAFRGVDLQSAFEATSVAKKFVVWEVQGLPPDVALPASRRMTRAEVEAHWAQLWGWEDDASIRRASEHVRRGLEAAPDHPDLRALEIQLLLAAGEFDQAVAHAEAWRDSSGAPEALHVSLELLLRRRGIDPQVDAALIRKRSGELSSTHRSRDHELLARAALALGDTDAAREHLRTALSQHPTSAACHVLQAALALRAGDGERAQKYATLAARLAGEGDQHAFATARRIRRFAERSRAGHANPYQQLVSATRRYDGRVRDASEGSGVNPGDACTLEVLSAPGFPLWDDYNCKLRLTCGARPLYGIHTTSGFGTCEVAQGRALRMFDRETETDPAFSWSLESGKAAVHWVEGPAIRRVIVDLNTPAQRGEAPTERSTAGAPIE